MKKRHLLRNIIVALFAIAFTGYFIYEDNLVYPRVSAEAGVSIQPEDFLTGMSYSSEASFDVGSDEIDITVPGSYRVFVKNGFFSHKSVLTIYDTIAPEVTLTDKEADYGQELTPEDFVVSVSDATATQIEFVNEPDFFAKESQTVEIAVTDQGGNTTVSEAELNMILVAREVDVEAGSPAPKLSDFVFVGDNARLITDLSDIDFSRPGDHVVAVEVNKKRHNVDLYVRDTVPPEISTRNVETFTGLALAPERFVESCEDVTEVSLYYEKQPDFSREGTQNVTIVARDEGNNTVTAEAVLVLKKDVEPPVIYGASNKVIFIGEAVSYRAGVNVKDNCPEGLNLIIQAGSVNLNVPGEYPVRYIATDAAGNTTTADISVTVKQRMYSSEEVNAIADTVLAKIINPSMGIVDKARAIYYYTKRHISYTGSSDKSNFYKEAYNGFVFGRGDCFTYYAVSKVLLTRAGIPNRDIWKIPDYTVHYWNLINIGDGHGWYHFDTTPRIGAGDFFMWGDVQLKAYSDTHRNSHNYDRIAFPGVGP